MKKLRRFFTFLLVLIVLHGIYHVYKPMWSGLEFEGRDQPSRNVEFINDLTWVDEKEQRHTDQHIFDSIFSIIKNAKKFVVLDMFLFNDFHGQDSKVERLLARQLTDALIAKKKENPDVFIVVVTDPINEVYGALDSPYFEALGKAGVEVITTSLGRLRDSNPIYSAPFRVFINPLGNSDDGWLPNPFGAGKVTLRSYLRIPNFKANHRKSVIADAGDDWVGLVTSANPHDGSSAHSNVAIKFSGPAAVDLLRTEMTVMKMSHGQDEYKKLQPILDHAPEWKASDNAELKVQVVTERRIMRNFLRAMESVGSGSQIDVSMFYLSHRKTINAIELAHDRGADIRVLLDPNKDAFGMEKNGIPNRQVAAELMKKNIPVKWCDTHGEQCHSKMVHIRYSDGTSFLMAGSANFTRRNLEDYNLETDVIVMGPGTQQVFMDARKFFDRTWKNEPKRFYSASYEKFAEESDWKTWAYYFMEFTGLSSF